MIYGCVHTGIFFLNFKLGLQNVCLFICLFVCLFICLFVYLFIYLFIYLFVYLLGEGRNCQQ